MHPRGLDWKTILMAGALSGIIQVCAGVTMYLAGVYFAPWSGLLSLVVLALCMVAGLQWYGRTLDRPVTYLLALTVGLSVVIMTAVTYIVYNVVSVSFLYPHFLEDMAQARFARSNLTRIGDTQARGLLDALRAQTTLRAVVWANFTFLTRMGVLLAALLALAFPRGRRRPPPTDPKG